MSQFKVGDIVALKSNVRVAMTVAEVIETTTSTEHNKPTLSQYKCKWLDKNNNSHSEIFEEAMLMCRNS